MSEARERPGRAQGSEELLVFMLGGDAYGVPVGQVCELRRYQSPIPLSGAPACVIGTVDVRGRQVPVIDLRIRFALGRPVYDQITTVMILEFSDLIVGAVVDGLADVVAVPSEQIRPAPRVSSMLGPALREAVGVDGERLMLLADMRGVLAPATLGLGYPNS